MQRQLTITMDEEVYKGLYAIIGSRRISHFIEELVRPYVLLPELDAAYARMAADEEHEANASAWVEGLIGEIEYETW